MFESCRAHGSTKPFSVVMCAPTCADSYLVLQKARATKPDDTAAWIIGG